MPDLKTPTLSAGL